MSLSQTTSGNGCMDLGYGKPLVCTVLSCLVQFDSSRGKRVCFIWLIDLSTYTTNIKVRSFELLSSDFAEIVRNSIAGLIIISWNSKPIFHSLFQPTQANRFFLIRNSTKLANQRRRFIARSRPKTYVLFKQKKYLEEYLSTIK